MVVLVVSIPIPTETAFPSNLLFPQWHWDDSRVSSILRVSVLDCAKPRGRTVPVPAVNKTLVLHTWPEQRSIDPLVWHPHHHRHYHDYWDAEPCAVPVECNRLRERPWRGHFLRRALEFGRVPVSSVADRARPPPW